MSVSFSCICKPKDKSKWVVDQYKEHRSVFNGRRPTYSNYSQVRCTACGRTGRTKAKYVEEIKSNNEP